MERGAPRLLARFYLAKDNAPDFQGKTDGKKNYTIRIFIENAPEDTHAVTYQLHSSYFDPIREVRRPPSFEEEVNSYGDYDLQARIRRRKRADVVAARLSDALRDGHADDMTPAISEAIDEIKKY